MYYFVWVSVLYRKQWLSIFNRQVCRRHICTADMSTIADIMTELSGKNFTLSEAEAECFLAIMDTLLHHLILNWVCEASWTI